MELGLKKNTLRVLAGLSLVAFTVQMQAAPRRNARRVEISSVVQHNVAGRLEVRGKAQSLRTAVKFGDVRGLRRILQRSVSADTALEEGRRALHFAVEENQPEIINLLLRHNASVNLADDHGWTPLHLAAHHCYVEAVVALLESGADVHACQREGATALHLAAQSGSIQIVDKLLGSGARVNAIAQGKATALHFAAQNGHVEVVTGLLRGGACVDAVTAAGKTALHFAAQKGHVEVVTRLLRGGACVDAIAATGDTALHFAARNGHVEVVTGLLRGGAGINAVTAAGKTALHFAAQKGHVEVVTGLLRGGACVDAVTAAGETALSFAVANGHGEVIDALLEGQVNVHACQSDGNTALHFAADKDNAQIVDRLLRGGACVDAVNQAGLTALHFAAQKGHVEVVTGLLRGGACVDAVTAAGETALSFAVANGHGEVIDALLEGQVNVHACQSDGNTALHFAADKDNAQIVDSLLRGGACVDAVNQAGLTALHFAAGRDNVQVVDRLLRSGARIDIADDKKGFLVLHLASLHGCEGAVNRLLDAGADVNARCKKEGITPLFYAAANGHAQVVNSLLRGGARVDDVIENDVTALHLAAQNGHAQVVNSLLKGGARVDAATLSGMTALYFAARNGHVQVVDRLLQANADMNFALSDGAVALHIAASNGNVEIVGSLLGVGADVNSRDKKARTALHFAAQKGHVEIVRILLRVGADVKACFKGGWTALHFAAQNGHVGVVDRLLDAGADVNACAKGGVTALILAAQNGLVGIVKNLLRAGANVDVCSKEGWTALGLAIRNGHTEVVSTLKAASGSTGNRGARKIKGTIAQGAGDNQELTAEQVKSRHMEKLFAAIYQSDLTSLRQCLKSEIDPLYKNEHGNTVLIAAVKKAAKVKESSSRIVRELLRREEIRGTVNEPGSKGVTALMAAMADAEIVGFLLDECKQNLKLDCVDEHGQTVFAHAAHNASPRVMRTLLAFATKNVEPNDLWDALTQRDQKGNSATMIAARSGKHENAELLLQAIESLVALNDERVRHVSEQKEYVEQCRHSHSDTMSAIASDEDDQKEEPVELQQAQKECIDLLRAGSWKQFNKSLRAYGHVPSWLKDQFFVDGQSTTVLHLALEATNSPSQRFLKMMLSTVGGRVVNLTDHSGRQPLDLAIATGKRGLIKALLAHKAQVQVRHITEVAAIVATVQNQGEQQHWQGLQESMQKKLDVIAVTEPAEYATKDGIAAKKQSNRQKQLLAKIADKSVPFKGGWIKELLSTGFDVNTKLEQQMTLLMRAADAGSLEAIDALLKAGANVNAKDAHGDTAFAYASRTNHTALANRLCVAMAAQGFKKKPSALGHITQRHARKAPKSLKNRGVNVKDKPFFIEEMRTIRDSGKTMRKKCKAHQFPERWDKQKIQQAICAVLSNPQQVVDNHAEIDDSGTVVRGTLAVEGVVHGLNMRVVVSNPREEARWCVFTAYPLLSSRTR